MKAIWVNHKSFNQGRGARIKVTLGTCMTGLEHVELEIGTARTVAGIRLKLRGDVWYTKSNLEPSVFRVNQKIVP